MKTVAVLAALAGSAAAFAPSQPATRSASTQLQAAFEDDFGATLPLGFWDPLGLVADGDQAKFDRLRYVEIKHGRISMLAIIGYLVSVAGWRLPGYCSISENLKFEDIPAGYAGLEAIPYYGKIQLLLGIGALEVFGWKQAEGSFPGDFSASSFPVGWVADYDEATKLRKRTVELNQGRAAMMGILGLMVHEQMGVNILPTGMSGSDYDF